MSKQQCIFISLVEIPSGIPAHFIDNGVLYLDTDDATRLPLTKAPQELNSKGKIKDEAVRNFSLPVTPKNELTLRSFLSPVAYKRSYAPIKVNVIGGGLSYRVTYLNVIRSNNDKIECQLIRDKNHWLVLASQTSLRDVDWGDPIIFSSDIVKQSWDHWRYDGDPSKGYMFAIVDYGKFFHHNKVVSEDTRPLFNPIYILQTAFCHIGYSIESEFFDDDFFKQMWSYYLREDYGTIPELLSRRDVSVNVTFEKDVSDIYDEVFDPSDVFNDGIYSAPVVADFFFDFTMSISDVNRRLARKLFIQIVRKRQGDDEEEILAEGGYELKAIPKYPVPNADVKFSQTIEALNVILDPNDQVYLLLLDEFGNKYYLINGVFHTRTRKTYFQKGDEMFFGELFRDDTILDYFKGFLHFINGKVEPQFSLRKITAFPPYESTLWKDTNEEIGPFEGFYKPNSQAIDLTDEGLCEGGSLINERAKVKRFHLYQFADSSDAKIDDLNLEQEPFSHKVDLGDEYENKTTEYPNPIFEPTWSDWTRRFFSNEGVPMYLPFMWDNTDGELSFDIGPRMLFCIGKTSVSKTTTRGEEAPVKFRFETDEDTYDTEYPVLFHECKEKIVSLNNTVPIQKFVYGTDDNGFDLYTWFYRILLLSSLYSSKILTKVFLTPTNYRKSRFRDKYKVPFKGREFYAKALSISRYDPCSHEAAEILFLPDVGVDGVCPADIGNDGDPKINPCALNSPTIVITRSCDPLQVSADLGGIVESVIQTETWTVSIDGGVAIPYVPGSQIVGSTEELVFTYDAVYTDGCTAHVEKNFQFELICGQLDPNISFEYDNATNCVKATGDSVQVDDCTTISNESWEVKIDNGGGYGSYAAYTEGDSVCNFECVTFKWTGDFDNNCPSFTVEQEFCAPPPICRNQPVIDCGIQGDGSLIPTIVAAAGGVITSQISFVLWQFTHGVDSQIYTWDGKQPLDIDGVYHLRALVKFCDGCPEICLESDCTATTGTTGDPDPKCNEWDVYIGTGFSTNEITVPTSKVVIPDAWVALDAETVSKNLFVILDGTIKIKDHPDGYTLNIGNKITFPYDLRPFQTLEVRNRCR